LEVHELLVEGERWGGGGRGEREMGRVGAWGLDGDASRKTERPAHRGRCGSLLCGIRDRNSLRFGLQLYVHGDEVMQIDSVGFST